MIFIASTINMVILLQQKVPFYLGGVSVIFCFMFVLVALALSLAIVPQQVMPWTGLLLMYEWTFTIFILLFGGYLHLVYQWGRRTSLYSGPVSSHSEPLDYDSGKGIVYISCTYIHFSSFLTRLY